MEEPLISVIVPIYNAEKYIQRCLDSIKQQTYQNLEVLLVDDGSTDSSPKLCDAYAAVDNRFRVFHKENGGVASARNTGLDNMSLEGYVAFVDNDDFLEPDMYEKMLNQAKETGVDIVSCGFYCVNENGQKNRGGSAIRT